MLLVLGTVFLFCQSAKCQTPYISPGLGFSWDFNGHFIFSPKVSVGIFGNGIFYNITIGRSSSSDEKIYPHYYVEVQSGKLTEPSDHKKTQLFYGGGIGFTIPISKNDSSVSFRVSAFTGYLLFLNVTVIHMEKIQTELGGQVVLPIPLKGVEFGPLGG